MQTSEHPAKVSVSQFLLTNSTALSLNHKYYFFGILDESGRNIIFSLTFEYLKRGKFLRSSTISHVPRLHLSALMVFKYSCFSSSVFYLSSFLFVLAVFTFSLSASFGSTALERHFLQYNQKISNIRAASIHKKRMPMVEPVETPEDFV
jgi:hypothetical protein